MSTLRVNTIVDLSNAPIGGALPDNVEFSQVKVDNIETTTDTVKIGKAAGTNETVDGGNVFVGLNAGEGAVAATRSTFVGKTAGFGADGDGNTYIGADTASAKVGQTGVSNTALGAAALNSIEGGSSNLVAGVVAGNQLTDGNANTLIGTAAGEFITTGSTNIVLGGGSNTGAVDVSNHIVIGSNTATPAVLGDHLTIGNDGNSWVAGTPDYNIRTGLINHNGLRHEYSNPALGTRELYKEENHIFSTIAIDPTNGGLYLTQFDLALLTSLDLQVKWTSNDGTRGFDTLRFFWNGTDITGTPPPTSSAFAFSQLRAEVLFTGSNGANTNLPFYTATGSTVGIFFQSNGGPLVTTNVVIDYTIGAYPPSP